MICVTSQKFLLSKLCFLNLLIYLVFSQSIATRDVIVLPYMCCFENTCVIIRAQEGIALTVIEERRGGLRRC